MVDAMQPLRPMERIDTLKQFLEHDRQVLRFGCYWDDRGIDDYGNEEGEIREMVLHYFLGDDTIEIRDIIRPNAGRDAVPVFVRRCKLPRKGHRLHQPGVVTDRTVLNVCNSRHLLDSFKTGSKQKTDYLLRKESLLFRETDTKVAFFSRKQDDVVNENLNVSLFKILLCILVYFQQKMTEIVTFGLF